MELGSKGVETLNLSTWKSSLEHFVEELHSPKDGGHLGNSVPEF